jgi:hypothetical protein
MRTHSSSRSRVVQPGGVVALPGDALAVVQLEDPAGDVVQEVAVVGDRHDRAGVLVQVVLEPGDRLGIQVIRRLVEQQQVGLPQQQAAEGHAATLAAGEMLHVGIAGRAAQRVHGQLEPRLELPAPRSVDLVLQPGLLGEQLLHLVGLERFGEAVAHLVEPIEQAFRLRDSFLDVLEHGLRRIELGLLVQVAHTGLLRRKRLAVELRVHTGHDAQQAALAGAVGPEDADLGAVEEREPDVLQDLPPGRHDLVQTLHGVDELGHPGLLGVKPWHDTLPVGQSIMPGLDPSLECSAGRRRWNP